MDHHVSNLDDFALLVLFIRKSVLLRLGPTQYGLYSGKQYFGAERLCNVVVGPHIQPRDDVGFLALGREHDNGDRRELWVLFQLVADPQPIQAGQHDVQEDQVPASWTPRP